MCWGNKNKFFIQTNTKSIKKYFLDIVFVEQFLSLKTLFRVSYSTDENDFVEKAIELYTNKSIWETAQKNGYEIIEKRFKKKLYEIDFMNLVENLQKNLNEHRNQNFLGQILQHQSLQSTKYMSKWIEAKNS